jgi:hypothetical protein
MISVVDKEGSGFWKADSKEEERGVTPGAVYKSYSLSSPNRV